MLEVAEDVAEGFRPIEESTHFDREIERIFAKSFDVTVQLV